MTRVVIIGAGPAGLAAAAAAGRVARVTVIDDNTEAGGQIWRRTRNAWTIEHPGVETKFQARVIAATQADVTIETPDSCERLPFDKLILATGARELFLPFPGWTLPQVTGAGGLQALVKSGLNIQGKSVVVAGTGPLLLAVAAYLKSKGATIPLIAEQAPAARVNRFARSLLSHPGKLWQGARLKARLLGVPYRTDCWVESAEPGMLRLRTPGGSGSQPFDYLAIGYGLWPNTELAQLAGCRLSNGFVEVDAAQRTSIPNIYCAGEPTGIGGVDMALAEGRIAGCHATGQPTPPLPNRAFVQALTTTFALRPEVRAVATADTIVCRCEDVPLSRIQSCQGWREAKLQTRCGMGPCQGRICGPAIQTILGWPHQSIREPVFPARIESLLT